MCELNTAMAYISRPRSFDYHYQTIPERLTFLAGKLGDKEVYVFFNPHGQRESISANGIVERSKNIAHSLVKLGIKKGDVVAACLPNDLDGLLCILGIICAGGISLNVVVNKEDGSDLVTIMNKGKVKCLIVKSGASGAELKACRKFIGTVRSDGTALSESVPTMQYLVTLDTSDWGCKSMDGLLQGREAGHQLPTICPDNEMVIFPTSGSTGHSKLVPHSHFGAMITGHHLQESILFETDDVIYTERRMAWIGGFPYMYLHNGVKTITKTASSGSLMDNCKLTCELIKRENCTIACLLSPTIVGLNDVVGKSEFMLKNLHTGGLPVANVCMDAIGNFSTCVTNCYGSTEAAFLTSNHVTSNNVYVNYCSGFPHCGVEIKILNEHGELAKRNEDGNVFARSPGLFNGYYNDHDKSKEVLSLPGWFNTDDIGYIDDLGRLCVHGRQSDLILQSGKQICPAAMESFIKSHPDVLDVLVVAVPDDAKFEVACACVIAKEGRELSPGDIQEFYESKLISSADDVGRKLYPEQILMFDTFPRLYTGKPDKRKVKELAIKQVRKHNE